MQTPRTLRGHKLVVKVGLRQFIGAGLMLQDLMHWVLWVRVQDKLRLDKGKVSNQV